MGEGEGKGEGEVRGRGIGCVRGTVLGHTQRAIGVGLGRAALLDLERTELTYVPLGHWVTQTPALGPGSAW